MTLRQRELLAPAKINLYLEILGRRADGFHELESIFQTIDLSDRISVRELAAANAQALTQIHYSNVDADYGNADICYRAVEAVRAQCPSLAPLSVVIEKHIPVGGGLGGASSDAAALLKTLAAWYALDDQLIFDIALELGSDVPFFLSGGTMHALGRGEILHALPVADLGQGYLLKLALGQETAAVFKAMSEEERGPRQARGINFWQTADLAQHLFNRLSDVTRRLHPSVDALLSAAEAAAIPVYMTGSGSTCFSFDPRVRDLQGCHCVPFRCIAAS